MHPLPHAELLQTAVRASQRRFLTLDDGCPDPDVWSRVRYHCRQTSWKLQSVRGSYGLLVQEILVEGTHYNPPFHSHAGLFTRFERWSSAKPRTARAQYWSKLSLRSNSQDACDNVSEPKMPFQLSSNPTSGLSNSGQPVARAGFADARSVSFERPIIPLRLNAKN